MQATPSNHTTPWIESSKSAYTRKLKFHIIIIPPPSQCEAGAGECGEGGEGGCSEGAAIPPHLTGRPGVDATLQSRPVCGSISGQHLGTRDRAAASNETGQTGTYMYHTAGVLMKCLVGR